jgi:hypothetical protein
MRTQLCKMGRILQLNPGPARWGKKAAYLYPASPKPRGYQITSDLIAQVRINLESVELAAKSRREASAWGWSSPVRPQAMIELLRSTQDFLIKAGQAHAQYSDTD